MKSYTILIEENSVNQKFEATKITSLERIQTDDLERYITEIRRNGNDVTLVLEGWPKILLPRIELT